MKAKKLLKLLEAKGQTCSEVSSIEDINAMFNYEDTSPWGVNDEKLISCGQSNGYNELKRFYNTYLKTLVENEIITKKQALKTLCECCKEIDFRERTHEKFKKCVSRKLGIKLKMF